MRMVSLRLMAAEREGSKVAPSATRDWTWGRSAVRFQMVTGVEALMRAEARAAPMLPMPMEVTVDMLKVVGVGCQWEGSCWCFVELVDGKGRGI